MTVREYCIFFLEMRRSKLFSVLSVQYSRGLIEAAELDRAEIVWIRSIQKQSFEAKLKYLNYPTTQIKPLYVYKFGLYLDSTTL